MLTPAYASRQSGLSLVELMVGMMVGLIGIIIISHLYLTNEQYKRSTTGAGAAQVNGAIALYSIERDLRMAGYGINHIDALGCSCDTATDPNCSPVQYFFNGTYSSPPAAPGSVLRTLMVAPVVIVKTANKPDSITVLYGTDNERAAPAMLEKVMQPPKYDYNTQGIAGFGDGDIVVITQGASCVLGQTTVNKALSTLERNVVIYNPNYNPVNNGTLPVFSRGAQVFNLGATPLWRTYTIANNKLRATDVLPPQGNTSGQDLVDDIIDMQAQYGKDTLPAPPAAGDKVVDVYQANPYNVLPPATADDWQRILAIRIAILARSQNYEKPDPVTGLCNATLASPTWSGGTFPALVAALAAPGSEAGCYKYRVFETVVPLRNMIWR